MAGQTGSPAPTTTYRGHIGVWRRHLHQVDVVGSVLPGGVVVIDVQEGDVDLWGHKGTQSGACGASWH